MIRLVLKLWKTHTHPCCCVSAEREQEGRAVQTAQKGPAVWEVSAKIASWRPLHHSQNTWLLPLSLSSLKDFSGGEKQVRDGSPYLNSHLHSSSCLIFSLFCKFSVTLLCLVLFFFFPLHLPCAAIIFSLSFYCTVIMILPPNDVFGLKSFWCTQRKALCWVSATTNVTLKHRNAYCIHG